LFAAEQSGSGYVVAWRDATAGQYIVWKVASDGSYAGTVVAPVGSADFDLESIETTFHQDLNGDGRIGAATASVETAGATALVQVADRFFMRDGAGQGPALTFQGLPIIAHQFGTWAPIAAERSGDGYLLAWKDGGSGQYTVWTLAG